MRSVSIKHGPVGRALPKALGRAGDLGPLSVDPLDFFRRARAALGDAVVLRDGGPVFSRTKPCAGSLVLFGAANARQVLSDIETFALPQSAARDLALPRRLVNLNFGLHSRTGEAHRRHLVALKGALSERHVAEQAGFIAQGLAAFDSHAMPDRPFALLAAMRTLTLEIASRILLGDRGPGGVGTGARLMAYFEARRAAASPFGTTSPAQKDVLTALGLAADEALRARLRGARDCASPSSLLGRLAALPGLTQDEIVGHLNVLFISSCEPVAVALTWIFLVLSQRPGLRAALRREMAGGAGALLGGTVKECLRLLPPNALMLRLTRRAVALEGGTVPKNCEIVLCPFLEQRDPAVFPKPDEFRPERWTTLIPPPFTYLPFGGGGHHCVGSVLALSIITSVLRHLLPRHDFLLSGHQEIDWRIDVQFFPRTDPIMMAKVPRADRQRRGGRILGPVHSLIHDAS
jgi:cytochrome P450